MPQPLQPHIVDPAASRDFAASVVSRLRSAGHEAYWAGGCVRDELLGRTPADYDVATDAPPEIVRNLFGRRRTLAIGAAFGVITVLGPKSAGQVEVATFRADVGYTDGRHPTEVIFCSAREDARRRDFTINGLFLDPLTGAVHDFVGGREDLAAGIVRAIGPPAMRFGEDHLRMLRAVRFAATFGFAIERDTRLAIERMAHLVVAVSPERIAAELRGMTSGGGRRLALELLEETGLAREVLPEVAPADEAGRRTWRELASIVAAIDEPSLPQALALLVMPGQERSLAAIATRLRLSTFEAKAARWLHAGLESLGEAADLERRPWSTVQPWAADTRGPLLADLLRARAACGRGDAEAAAWFTRQVERPRHEIDPTPILTGDDLLAAGMPAGPAIGEVLVRIRTLQLDGRLTTKEEALAAVREGG
ncbi:MAG: CCA tRNA nucleotidyltransferase [Planctomycetes bacterium]|nr:CCA tRNA nucleotidyltransferase [Planctomycetota bacterium]